VDPRLLLVAGSLLGAAGQVLLKLGADGAVALSDYLNMRILAGVVCYAFGTLVWVLALARLPLSKAYPFTILTFALVYVASVLLLGERISVTLVIGVIMVLSGLLVIVGF
jgi:drug/metabolite transporter (DMT)-like permease